MNFESWMISLVIAIVSIIGNFAVLKYMVTELKKEQQNIIRTLDKYGDDIVRLNTRSELAITAKDVDNKYVSKEMFRQMEKHIDDKVDILRDGIEKILNKLESSK